MAKYNFEGKTAIITGASAGLGEQFAYAFAESGASVVLAARRKRLLMLLTLYSMVKAFVLLGSIIRIKGKGLPFLICSLYPSVVYILLEMS